jgi:hypothetical protein
VPPGQGQLATAGSCQRADQPVFSAPPRGVGALAGRRAPGDLQRQPADQEVDHTVRNQPDAGEPLQRRAIAGPVRPCRRHWLPSQGPSASTPSLAPRSRLSHIRAECWEHPMLRRNRRLTIGPRSSDSVLPRAGRLLLVPPLVDRAASSGVVPGEPGGAAVMGAGSGFAEGADHRSGASGAASASTSQHGHACIVPPPKQGKRFSAWPYPTVGSLWSHRVG